MKAVEILKKHNYTCVALKDDFEYHSKKTGISPLLDPMLEDELYFKDMKIADKVIGKSAAMLLIKSQVKHIYAVVLSEHAKKILDVYGIPYNYEKLVPYIVNRTKDGMCPMEQTVLDMTDLNQAFHALISKREELMNKK